jgi:AraC-like DNA-binding protein
MSRMHQGREAICVGDDDLTEERVNGLAATGAFVVPYGKGECVAAHGHQRGQLLCPLAGTVRVHASPAAWLVTVGQALWLRPDTRHSIDVLSAALLQLIYVDLGKSGTPAPAVGRIDTPPLLQGILAELRAMSPLYEEVGPLDRLTAVMLDQVAHARSCSLPTPCPDDRRLAMIYRAIIADPPRRRTLQWLAEDAGVSARTVERLLRESCNMSFRAWRESILLSLAFSRLRQGGRVTDIALDLGYAGASAFIAAFKRFTGVTPRRWRQQALLSSGSASQAATQDIQG